MTDVAPVALFAFNRPAHTAETLAALAANDRADETRVTVFCDGPRSHDDRPGVEEVRRVARNARGFESVRVVERPENLGLARSVIRGVSETLEENETVIVVEDDLITSPYFLRFMNDGLGAYAEEERVISVCGYTYPTEQDRAGPALVPGAHCWGWATWRRGWSLFEPDPMKLLRGLEQSNLIYEFDIEGSFPHTLLLRGAAAGRGDSWALRWMGAAILHGRLTLYPGRSMVHNAGMDDSGTHGKATDLYDTSVADKPLNLVETLTEPDSLALAQRVDFHVRMARDRELKRRLYYGLAKLLPRGLEKRLYTSLVRRSLRILDRR